MKQFPSRLKNSLYLGYRLINPIIDPIRFFHGIMGYPRYLIDMYTYGRQQKNIHIHFKDLYPVLDEKTAVTSLDAHYYYQQLWAFKHVLKRKPRLHVDVASSYQFSGYVALLTKSEFVDIRPIDAHWPNLTVRDASIVRLPYEDNSVPSISCLSVLEHIGLGRYGDPIDPQGPQKAGREITRVLKPGGYLYLSVPVGRPRICFNAHRVMSVKSVISLFRGLKCVGFSLVDDNGIYHEKSELINQNTLNFGCGLFKFTKE